MTFSPYKTLIILIYTEIDTTHDVPKQSLRTMMNNEDFTPLTIFKASAGSGKTYTLSATYIAQLLTADAEEMPHKHQLAVTFTNKATAEMKERIVQYLYDIANNDDENDVFFETVRDLVTAEVTNSMLRARARKALFNIIHDYDHFHVTTIDSFFQSLLSSLAHELSLSASFKVELGDKEVLSKAVDRLLSNLQENGEELKWLTIYIKERMNDDKSWNVADELKSLASQILKEAYMLHSDILKKDNNIDIPGAVNLDNKTVDSYKETLKAAIKCERQRLAEKASSADQFITSGIGYDHISGGARSVKSYLEKLANMDLPVRDLKAPTDTFLKYASGEKSMLKKANQKSSYEDQIETVRQYLEAVVHQYEQSIYIINSCNLSIANLNPLRLLDAIDKEVTAINRENDRMLLARTPLLFHNLRGENDTSFVFERAGTRYHHVMIDEFQDTSRLQWDNMRQLLIENMSQGNSCMLVGDVKQGIYRFRGGDWNALAGFQKGKDPQFHLSIDIQTLKTNFRSGEEIVKFNNRVFTSAPSVVMSAIEDVWGNYDYIQDEPSPSLDIERIYPTPGEVDDHEVTQLTKFEGGFVRVEFLNNETEEQKAERKKAEKEAKEGAAEGQEAMAEDDSDSREATVAEQMMRLHEAGVPYSEMAILIRSKNDAQPLMKYFETHHGQDSEHPIALMSEEAFLLESSPSVMTIINALRYVSNREDKIALAFLHMQCPGSEDFESILSVLDRWSRERYSGLPFYEVSCRIASMFRLHDRKGQSPYLYFFLDAVLAYIDDHSANVKAFLEYWDESLHQKSIPSAAVDGVRILTIHKSKGLAFHSVFIPYCDWKIDKNGMHELIWTLPSQEPFNHIPFLPVEMKKEAGYSIYRDIFKQETFDRYIENLNLLYVAFTRAKQNLLVWADCSAKGIATILRDSLTTNEDIIEFGSPSSLFISKLSETKVDNDADETKVPAMRSEDEVTPAKSKTPLEYKQHPIFINFSNYTPRLVFRQSNNAELFLHPDDEEREEMAAAAESCDAARREQLKDEYRMTGILLHELMSAIENADDVDAQIDEAARIGQLPPSLSTESVRRLITRRMSHPTAREWFDGSWRLYRECSLVFREKDETGHEHIVSRRPDRVMVRGNVDDGTDETIIVDFKFGKYKSEHRQQVERYKELIKSQGRHNVKGYLWYLYTGSIEAV